jgi:glyoxylase-like metal-dependent hydrolase (beta-lactamase superfamily II)
MKTIDVQHLGRERVIACFDVDGVLIDPGPEASLPNWIDTLEAPPKAVLLTHIHFDHAGASGALVRRWPELPVYVHTRGARHMASPERLVASATRLYGEEGMQELWGEVVPVPEENLRPLEGGEEVLGFKVAYTPGHASHHVSYLHEATGTAFCGDVAGVRIKPADLTVAPTPPPDIDVELWMESLDTVQAWDPSALAVTHFGIFEDVEEQLGSVRRSLLEQQRLVRETDMEEFVRRHWELLRAGSTEEEAQASAQAAIPEHLYLGLERWLSKNG